MTTSEKRNLTSINKIEKFRIILEKLTLAVDLEYDEKVYILSMALIFIDFYKKDKRHTSYREFAYYIVLKYSLQYEDYKPLYDLSIDFGFYPISKDIINKNLIDSEQIKDILIDNALETYRTNEKYIETFEQYMAKLNLLRNDFNEIVYIAPTSFGKSSVMVDLIKVNT